MALRWFVVVWVGLLFVDRPEAAAQDWAVRARGSTVLASPSDFDADSSAGFEIGLEMRGHGARGFELGTGWMRAVDSTTTEDLDLDLTFRWIPLYVGANYHLDLGSRSDLYVGTRLGFAFIDGEVELRDRFGGVARADAPSETVWLYGLRAGFDRELRASPWWLSASLDYSTLRNDYAGPVSISGFSLVSLGVGVARRF
ncbi:MAG: outer membrane beta-barrel protein [Acidobacteriota bacterium]